MIYVKAQEASEFLDDLDSLSVDLFVLDPPYFEIVPDVEWDNQWESEDEYVNWLLKLLNKAKDKLKSSGSLVLFGGIGKHGEHPVFDVVRGMEKLGYCYRNWITWKKRRAYGKSHDYLFCREEIFWFSASHERTKVTFNVPLTNIKRGYAGKAKKYNKRLAKLF